MMATSGKNKCLKCKKAIKSTEMVLVCGLWCRNSFHNECLGLTDREARSLIRSKVRIKFHCEACEQRLAIELLGGRETLEAKNLENCVSLLDVVQKLVKLTTELSTDNSTINSKLDIVLTSTARLEEYFLPSAEGVEKQNDETLDHSVGYAANNYTKRITDIREQNNNLNSHDQIINSEQMCHESEFLQAEDNLQRIAHEFPEQVADRPTENCSSDSLQEWEVPEGEDNTHDPLSIDDECMQDWEQPGGQVSLQDSLSIVKEEPSEDFFTSGTLNIEETENGKEEEKAVMEDNGEKYSSEDFFLPSTLNTEKTEKKEDEETVNEDNFEELKHEVESTISGGEADSSVPACVEDDKINNDSRGLVNTICPTERSGHRIQHTVEHKVSCVNKVGTRILWHRSDVCKETIVQREDLKYHTYIDGCEAIHSCSICRKTFATSRNLKRHSHVHSGERQYSCNICNKTVIQKCNLKTHVRVHTDERPHNCSICNKTFRRNCDLKQHSYLHTGQRPHSCGLCHKRFKNTTCLKVHSRRHTGETPYTCNICLKKFSYRSSLTGHLAIHTRKRTCI